MSHVKNRSIKLSFPLLARVFLLLFFFAASPHVAWSQDSTTAPGAEDVSSDQVNDVARELWCPLCSGVRLDACELKACDQMKEVIAIKLSEGENTDTIRAYFVEQYGPQVLGEPPREGFNWLAWILPFAALAAGAVFMWRKSQQMMQTKSEFTDAPLDPPTPSAPGSPDEGNASAGQEEDEYSRKLEEELDNYG